MRVDLRRFAVDFLAFITGSFESSIWTPLCFRGFLYLSATSSKGDPLTAWFRLNKEVCGGVSALKTFCASGPKTRETSILERSMRVFSFPLYFCTFPQIVPTTALRFVENITTKNMTFWGGRDKN